MPPRLASIDVFRALTMLLMIFVNDLWTLKDIPDWLEHTAAREDGMGLADTVFPAFLFIVGLSIPFAILNRKAKGESQSRILGYILVRSAALLIMGVFHVNLENYSAASALSKPVFQIAITVGFFLVWLDYPKTTKRTVRFVLQTLGAIILVSMAAIYKGDDGGWMKTHWWGILGLIGWAYLLCAVIFFYSSGNLFIIGCAFLFFFLFNIASQAGWLGFLDGIKRYVWIVGDGSMPALTMAGVFTGMLYRYLSGLGKSKSYFIWLALLSVVMIGTGFALRPHFIISKILATPSWVAINIGISLFVFLLLVWIVDIENKRSWFAIIRPAGTSTLTCYLLPYIHYAIYSLVGISLPLSLRTGGVGIVKCLLYALIIITITGLLERVRIRLKI